MWAPKETLTRRITYAQVEAWDAYAWNQLLDSFETLKSARDRQTDRLEWGMVVISLSKSSRKQLGATGILEEIKIHNFLNLRIIWLDFHLGKLSITPVREFLESLILPPSLEKLLLSVGISSSLSEKVVYSALSQDPLSASKCSIYDTNGPYCKLDHDTLVKCTRESILRDALSSCLAAHIQ